MTASRHIRDIFVHPQYLNQDVQLQDDIQYLLWIYNYSWILIYAIDKDKKQTIHGY